MNHRYLCRRDIKTSPCFFICQDCTDSRVSCSCDVDGAAAFVHRLCPMAALEGISVSIEEERSLMIS